MSETREEKQTQTPDVDNNRQDPARTERCREGIASPATQDGGPVDVVRAVDIFGVLLPLLRRLDARREKCAER
jgi:hypothetical protein